MRMLFLIFLILSVPIIGISQDMEVKLIRIKTRQKKNTTIVTVNVPPFSPYRLDYRFTFNADSTFTCITSRFKNTFTYNACLFNAQNPFIVNHSPEEDSIIPIKHNEIYTYKKLTFLIPRSFEILSANFQIDYVDTEEKDIEVEIKFRNRKKRINR